MARTVYRINGQEALRLLDRDEIAQGGEAVIYKIPPLYSEALKLYKQPNHPDFKDKPDAQKAIKAKLDMLQSKLREFPRGLPDKIITPVDFYTSTLNGTRIDGYSMKFLKGAIPFWNYTQSDFRERGGIDPNSVVGMERKLHGIVVGAHAVHVLFSDFNSLNILILGDEVYYVDADSMAWGRYISPLYTITYVDPLLCTWDPQKEVVELVRPHTENSDWYAYTVMLMESMVYSGPYNGNYRPKDPSKRMHPNMRPLKRVTVWNPEVIYPKWAFPIKVLPDNLVEYFIDVFHYDKRGVFPLSLLDNLRWTKCSNCGSFHARNACPYCAQIAPAAVKQKVIMRGNVVATRIFPTSTQSGTILHATTQNMIFRYLYHDGRELRREDGRVISKSVLDHLIRYRICGDATLFAKDGRLVVVDPLKKTETIQVDSFGTLPIYDANGDHYYWAEGGSLYRDGEVGPEFIGNVLENQTLFWVGPKFGLGFWRAGEITTGFVFDTNRSGINDTVNLPAIKGQLLNSSVTFSGERAWLFISTQVGGRTINQCIVVTQDGTVEATAEAQDGDGSWLGVITGKCAVGNFLLSATDDGIVRVEAGSGGISVTKEFPDTEPFVNARSLLFAHKDGLVVLSAKEIYILQIS
jgi:hypothetical protein